MLFNGSENSSKPPRMSFWIKKVIFGKISSGLFLILHSFLNDWTAPGFCSSFFSITFASYPTMLPYGVNFMYLKFALALISEWAAGELRGKKAYSPPPPPFTDMWGLWWIMLLGLINNKFWVWNALNLK